MRWVVPAAVVALVLAFSYLAPIPILRSHLLDTTYLVTHKATGGGQVPGTKSAAPPCGVTVIAGTGGPATFGFNAKATSTATSQGELEFRDHSSGVTIHGDVISFNECAPDSDASFSGTYVVKNGSCSGGASPTFTAGVHTGNKNTGGIFAITFSGTCSSENRSAAITAGNITVH
jgi:hypothetical protein